MYKIGNIKTSGTCAELQHLAKAFEGMEFSIKIKNTNSKQMDSNIDLRIIEVLSDNYDVSSSKKDLYVEAEGKRVGELDIMFSDKVNIAYYMEIEKSNKKTLWFDYIKILTKLASKEKSKGIVMCPTNYAHSVGVWNLYKEAVAYKNHLKRVFGSTYLDRVSVIGYTQYAYLSNKWQEFDSSVVKKIKTHNE